MSNKNDLIDFLKAASVEIAAEYNRIQKRVNEDPGTAGDQAEENWAELLRNWLPPTYQIVTKGRIIGYNGESSPQIDILVLQPEYPKHLHNKKHYLASGVLAAFECKLTLRPEHIDQFVQTSVKMKSLFNKRKGNPYLELQSPILYGLVAHSHAWSGDKDECIDKVSEKLIQTDERFISHPILMPDLICIADLATWSAVKTTFMGPHQLSVWNEQLIGMYGTNGSATSSYMNHCHGEMDEEVLNPIAAMITSLLTKLAWNHVNLRPLAGYFTSVELDGGGKGLQRIWGIDIYSEEIRQQVFLIKNRATRWDEWGFMIT